MARRERHGRRARGLADTALPAKEQDALFDERSKGGAHLPRPLAACAAKPLRRAIAPELAVILGERRRMP
jgi:hypothetical protein